MMAFLLKQTKEVLLEVAIDLGVEVNSTLTKSEIKNRICQSKYYDEESVKCLLEGILEEEREKQEIKEYEERRLARERELERLRIQLRNKLNENKLKAGNRINDLANVCILSENRTTEVSESVNKCRPVNNPVVNKSVENATSCDFEKENCDPPVRCTNVSHPSEVGRKEFNVNRSSDCDVEMKVGVCEGRVKTVAMGAQRVIIPDNIVDGSFELKRDKGVANPEGLICENSCEEKYTLGTLMGCEKQLTVNRESFRNHTIAKIAGPSKVKENTCKADVRKCWEDGLALRLPLSEPREIYKDELATDNRSNIGSEFTFEIDLPGKRDRSTIYRLNLIKLYRRKPELANLVMENSSEGIDSETLYSVKLFMGFGFQGNLRKSQLYFKLPPDRSSYLRMINAKKKERFLPESGTFFLRRKDINLVTGKPFRIKTCCSSQMLINSLREDTKYLLDLGVNGMGQSNRTLPVVWLGRVNRYPYPRIKCMKYRNLNQVTRAEIYLLLKRERLVGKINAASWVIVLDLWKWYFRRSLMMNYPKHTTCVMTVGMYIIKKSRFKILCAYDECNLTTLILRLLEQIEVPRMVDIDILMEIWKNRVKKIDFVLKWLSRVGSEVGPTKGSGDRRRVAIMDFGAPLTIGEAYLKIIMSSFLGFCEWNTRNRWRDGQVCPDVDKKLWRLGPDSSGDGGDRRKKKRAKEEKELEKEKG
ncbi:uncharacterized protein TNCV_2779721 [Trichonephila clavipes]|nr:uncharacterized protein TNCV_2779721 [Trichonephila clavipes]